MFVKTQWDLNAIDGAYIEYVIQEGDNTRPTHWEKQMTGDIRPRRKT